MDHTAALLLHFPMRPLEFFLKLGTYLDIKEYIEPVVKMVVQSIEENPFRLSGLLCAELVLHFQQIAYYYTYSTTGKIQ